ncbi:phospholipase A2 inhibitor subunit gamma B-like isoform X2 [Rana temporaria]|uniref:phospholipase A2 inhibitor subunit gamma B-like isoform X2 n=1 Tax=Rana temporaria TaxID=8407 RepID=UPI001AADF1E5|nr:phospholipase A2 inhibitor subunit gamma B-like isoform X2 [Rana temporaria]
MKLSIALVCLLFAFISKGYALSCISCASSDASLCTGSSVTCNGANELCTTIYTTTTIEIFTTTSTTHALTRGCGQISECNQQKTLSNQAMTVNINTGCCNADNCNTTEPTATINTQPNGLECPSCFQLQAATCVPTSKVACTGAETRCTTYSMTSDSVPSKAFLAMEGCATENLCANYNGTTSTSTLGAIRINITCDKATKKNNSR